MVKGAFKKIEHKHFFEVQGSKTIMKDEFRFEAPLGILGKLSHIVLVPYLKNFLIKRNKMIKDVAESNQWKQLLTKSS